MAHNTFAYKVQHDKCVRHKTFSLLHFVVVIVAVEYEWSSQYVLTVEQQSSSIQRLMCVISV